MATSAVNPGKCDVPDPFKEILNNELSYYLSKGDEAEVYEHDTEDALQLPSGVMRDRYLELSKRLSYTGDSWGELAIGKPLACDKEVEWLSDYEETKVEVRTLTHGHRHLDDEEVPAHVVEDAGADYSDREIMPEGGDDGDAMSVDGVDKGITPSDKVMREYEEITSWGMMDLSP
ncbi:hypothetical protein VUR80DRAFT_5509 [Thermomyces stellatus]